MAAAPRYTVHTDVPDQLRRRFFVAWINDANHPYDPKKGASISWHLALTDAECVCTALNMAERLRLRIVQAEADAQPRAGLGMIS